MTYIAVLIFIVLASSWLEVALRTSVFRRWRRLIVTLAIVCPPFLLWDWLAVSWGHWDFDSEQLLDLPAVAGGLPLEEWLFFPVVGLAALLSFEGVKAVRRTRTDDESVVS